MTMMNNNNPQSSLPPGFRFHPTDEELILHYLRKKVSSIPIPVSIIAEVDIYKFDPWELPAQATFGEKEWYFFTPRDRKYPNGARPNRAAGSGYWKATGTDKVIMNSSSSRERQGSENIGVKKALVFYTGRPPKGSKTNWIMHEYRLAESPCTTIVRPVKLNKGSPMRLDDWVLCRIYKKSNVPPCAAAMTSPVIDQDQVEEEERFLFRDIKPPNYPIQTNTNTNTLVSQKSSSFSNLLDALDYSLLSSFLSEPNNNQNMSCFGPPCSNFDQSSFSPQDFSVSGCLDATLYENNNSNNGLKRQRSSMFDAEMSKKFNGSSCNFVNNGGVGAQFEISGQHSMFSSHNSLFNQQQQLLLGTNVQFLG